MNIKTPNKLIGQKISVSIIIIHNTSSQALHIFEHTNITQKGILPVPSQEIKSEIPYRKVI